jgi:hypothetical protein
MKHRQILATLALTVAAVTGWAAETPAPAPATADPLAGYIKPAEWLQQQPKPKFKEGHTLPPLTRYGWCLDFDTRVEFAEKWGYCLEFGGGYLSHAVVDRVLGNPNDPEAKILALAARDPKTYKLVVITSREMPPKDKLPPETWSRDADGKLLTGQAKSQDGNAWSAGVEVQWSPAAPVSVWEEVARLRAEPLRRLREKFPIAMVLNGGEEGIPVAGWGWKLWEKDPAVCNDNVAIRKVVGREITWAEYGSARMGRMQALIADAIRQAVPDRTLYVYYAMGGNAGPGDWAPGYKDMKASSDLPSTQSYHMHFNSGWTGGQDQLTQFLQAKSYEIAGGQPLSYNWLTGGPTGVGDSKSPTDIPRYTGFLKSCYTAGMIGGNAGFYDYPKYKDGRRGFEAKFPPDQPPHWIQQMMALGRVHAQFSHLEHYLRRGDLLPGPDKHRWSKNQPAYEFPTGDTNARVLARKLKDKPQWLITAWAADGQEREVTVPVPDLGEVKLKATAEANVYEVTLKDGKPVVKLAAGG